MSTSGEKRARTGYGMERGILGVLLPRPHEDRVDSPRVVMVRVHDVEARERHAELARRRGLREHLEEPRLERLEHLLRLGERLVRLRWHVARAAGQRHGAQSKAQTARHDDDALVHPRDRRGVRAERVCELRHALAQRGVMPDGHGQDCARSRQADMGAKVRTAYSV
jgi:hypothetical protein